MIRHTKPSQTDKRQKGQALAEFALVSPILLLAIMAIMDFSHVIISYVQAVGALREATRYAEVVGYVATSGGTPSYLDCDGMEEAARRVIMIDAQVVTIEYLKRDGVTTYNCDTVTAALLENGDMLRISSSARVDLLTPLVSAYLPSIQIDLRGQRTIIKDITLGLSYDVDSDFDGLLDSWELAILGTLEYVATDNLDSDFCNLGCEESRLLDPNDPDTDDDGLEDHDEAYRYETNGNDKDTDDDSLPNQTTPTVIDLNDYLEVNTVWDFSYLEDADPDTPPVTDPETVICTTSPIFADTDGDGVTDGQELTYMFDGVLTRMNPCDTDTDNDGLSDYEEYTRNTDPTSQDSDGDGLEDRDEIELHNTDPLNPDSDTDNLLDGDEISITHDFSTGTPDTPTCVTNANDSDTDGDTINDDVELTLGLNPCDPDWDNDGLLDGEEVAYSANPKLSDTDGDGLSDYIEAKTVIDDGTNNFGACMLAGDLDKDTDNDGLTDFEEFDYGDFSIFNPCVYDTDGDTVADGDEGSEADSDTDDDGLRDSWEITYFNTLSFGGSNDNDGDGLTNIQEHPINTGTVNYPGTNPMVQDTDADGLLDSVEYVTVFDSNPSNNLNPNNPDSDVDGLYDGYNSFTNIGENRIPAPYDACDTNPTLQDSDADGIKDNSELSVAWSSTVNNATQSETIMTNPCAPDTDGDGLYDGVNTLNGTGEMNYTNATYPSCKTHPKRTDTDSDGLSDSQEITQGTNPCDSDTDDDGLPDALEIALKAVYPTLSATDTDSDDDNFTDFDEYCDRKNGTDVPSGYASPKVVCAASTDPSWDTSPVDPDSDDDGRLDGNERKQSTDPFYITDPMVADTDEDGVNDGVEMTNGTKPNNKITVNIAAVTTVTEADKSNDPALAQTITVSVVNNNGSTPNTTSGSTEAIVLYWQTTQGSGSVTYNAKSYPIAAINTDFTAVSGSVVTGVNPITIPANTATITLTVYIIGDNNNTDSSRDEYFYADILYPGDSFSTPTSKRMTNAKLGTSRGFVIIDDRDS